MKKMMVTFLLLTLLITACGKKEETKQDFKANPIEIEKQEENSEVDETNKEDENEEIGTEESGIEKDDENVNITLYSTNDNADGFNITDVKIEKLTPENIMEKLIEQRVVPAEVKVVNFKEDKTTGTLDLDLSKAFEDKLLSQGSTGEDITFHSVANTYLKAYQAKEIKITIEGRALESGHQDFDQYFEIQE